MTYLFPRLQFAFVHYFTKNGFGELYFSDMTMDDEDDEQLDSSDEGLPSATHTPSPTVARKVKWNNQLWAIETEYGYDHENLDQDLNCLLL